MLAAASSNSDRTLETVRLVLVLEEKQQAYPETLKRYFRTVVQEALGILKKPSEGVMGAMPEAVSLAVKMAYDEALLAAITALAEETDISSEQAERALRSLEATFDTNCQLAHFGEEVFRAI